MKKIYILIIVLILAFVVGAIMLMLFRTGTLNVTSPIKSSQFIFNNKVYYTPAEIKDIPVGKHLITAHNDGYEDEQLYIEINSFSTTFLKLTMTPQSREKSIEVEEKTWTPYFNNQEDVIKKSITERETKNILTKFLPFSTGTIIFDYEVDKDGSVSYFVTGLPNQSYIKSDYEKSVADFILSKGVNPDSITIYWK